MNRGAKRKRLPGRQRVVVDRGRFNRSNRGCRTAAADPTVVPNWLANAMKSENPVSPSPSRSNCASNAAFSALCPEFARKRDKIWKPNGPVAVEVRRWRGVETDFTRRCKFVLRCAAFRQRDRLDANRKLATRYVCNRFKFGARQEPGRRQRTRALSCREVRATRIASGIPLTAETRCFLALQGPRKTGVKHQIQTSGPRPSTTS